MSHQCKSKDRSIEIGELIQHFDEQKIQLSYSYVLYKTIHPQMLYKIYQFIPLKIHFYTAFSIR